MPTLVTTAIDYTNGLPHIGHAYEKVLADAIARNFNCELLIGVDQHGPKIEASAKALNTDPQKYVNTYSKIFRDRYLSLDININTWVETSNPKHKEFVQQVLNILHDRGDIYLGEYKGFYSKKEERFVTEKEKYLFPDAVECSEPAYFFTVNKYLPPVHNAVAHFIPESKRQEILQGYENNKNDLCISRLKTKTSWGIELPFDDKFVTYVWFDALLNYISFTENFSDKTLQIIGKDILIPAHGVYWLAILNSLNLPIPRFLVHGFINNKNGKLSKSNNVTKNSDPQYLIDKYGVDAVRWYLLSIGRGQDKEFSEDDLVSQYNTLANNIGNLSNRIAKLASVYKPEDGAPLSFDFSLLHSKWNEYDTLGVQEYLLQYASTCNWFIQQTKLWEELEKGTEYSRKRLGNLLKSIEILAYELEPLLPSGSARLLNQVKTFNTDPVFPRIKKTD